MKIQYIGQLSLVILSANASALAGQENTSGVEFNAPPIASHQIGKNLWFGADVVAALESRDNNDLADSGDDHLTLFEPEVRTIFLYAPNAEFQALGELQIDGRAFLSKGSGNEEKSRGHLRIEQLYLDFPKVTDNLGVSVGRQRYKDARSWWYDDKIDMLRIAWRKNEWFASVSAGREKAFADDFAHRYTDKKVDFIIVTGGYHKDKREQTTLILIKKNDRETGRNEDPVFFGIQRVGEIGSDIRYWLDAALVRGNHADRRIRAYGVDTGFSVRFDGAWNPFITAALAHGSGDNQLDDGIDGNFRQTDLEDNESRTFGITSYNYYGEVTDFELGNMWIGTVAIGLRPNSDTSAELVYHRYRQADRNDDLFSSDLEIDPDGNDKALGDEINLVIAHRPNKHSKLSFTLGVFDPGEAFADDADPAWLMKLKLAYRF